MLSEQVQAGRIAVISWLSHGRKPSGQVIDRLHRQGFSEAVVESVVTSLQEDGYIDDLVLAQRIVRQRQGRQAESRAALNFRLHRLGLSENAIEKALPDEDLDFKAALELVKTRFSRQFIPLSDWAESKSAMENEKDRRLLRLKASRFLAGRGFSMLTINRVIKALFGIDSED